jgi:hypothetical protein
MGPRPATLFETSQVERVFPTDVVSTRGECLQSVLANKKVHNKNLEKIYGRGTVGGLSYTVTYSV